MRRVLVTAIGTMTSTAIIRSLRRISDVYLMGANLFKANETVTSLDVDEYFEFPSAVGDKSGYVDFLFDFCRSHQTTHLFASIDEEVIGLSKTKERFESIGVKLCIPNDSLIETCHFKDRFAVWVKRNMGEVGIETYKSLKEVGSYPIFVKPIEGRASIGCRRLDSEIEAIGFFATNAINEYVIQDCCGGMNITVDVVRFAANGEMRMLARKELKRNGNGCGVAVETFEDTMLDDICEDIAEKLDLNGVVNIEFFKTESGYKIIEVNPRFSAGTDYSVMSGFNTPMYAMEIADGKCPSWPESIVTGKHFAKRYETYLMD